MDTQAYIQSGVIESYVLGLASAEEAAELLELSRLHPAIQQALDETEIAFEKNAMANASVPDAAIREQLLATLQNDFIPEEGNAAGYKTSLYATTASSTETTNTASVVNIYPWKRITAACIILLAISVAFNYHYYNNYKQSNEKYEALLNDRNTLEASINVYKANMQLIESPATATIKMPGVAGKENSLATLYWNTQTKDVYIIANQLPQAPSGKQYQLWAIVNGKPVDAGVMNCNEGLCKMKNIPTAEAFAITLEKEGGSSSPTLTEMYVLGKVS
ncbi:Anti-sigma-K factor rskA [Filimonas lacunae]|uniref:Anti-sigma-K factor rskA n=1 Tax=Filimonas lacunae TaxID=477680 RepID=A0A173MP11_9BACT|nr:anti-sigma factor [Filimonas lacunae]BAV09226.1 hypothetical protein FLA_5274 [Filimonas lacunae]SIS69315.1 Anti-sigma-K factor rskA [Filimonas lacunae]